MSTFIFELFVKFLANYSKKFSLLHQKQHGLSFFGSLFVKFAGSTTTKTTNTIFLDPKEGYFDFNFRRECSVIKTLQKIGVTSGRKAIAGLILLDQLCTVTIQREFGW